MNIDYKSFLPEQLRIKAADKLNELIRDSINNDNNYLLMLSGGSSVDLLELVDVKYLNNKFTICVLDERYDYYNSNYVEVKNSGLIDAAVKNHAHVINTQIQNSETQQQLADRFNKALDMWLKMNPNGVVIATVGIGSDGHVAGIMPFNGEERKFKMLFDGSTHNEYVVSYDAKNKFPLRVTTTFKMLRRIDIAISYAIDKVDAVKMIFSVEGSLSITPSRILREINKVYLFTNTDKNEIDM